MRKLLFIIIFFIVGNSLPAQHWKVYFDSTQVYWAKNWPKTITLLEKSSEIALADLGMYNGNYLTILNDLGVAYSRAHKYDQAKNTLEKALKIKKEVYGEDHEEYISTLLNLASLESSQGSNTEAISIYKQIIKSSGEIGTAQIPYYTAIKNLGRLYEAEYKWAEARDIYKQGQNHISSSDRIFFHEMLLGIGRVNRKTGRLNEAETDLLTALKFIESAYINYPDQYKALYAEALNEVGLLYEAMNDVKKAEVAFLKSNQLLKNDPYKHTSLLSESYNNLAGLYKKLGIYDKALQYLMDSWKNCYTSFGQRSVECTTIKNNLASIYLETERNSTAIDLYKEVLASYSELITKNHPLYLNALNNLASAYIKAGMTKAALVEIDKALNVINEDDASLYGTLLANKGLILTQMKEFQEAISYYEQALHIKKTILGDNSIALKDIESNLALTLMASGNDKRAQELFLSALNKELRFIKYVFPNLSENEKRSTYNSLKRDFERFNTLAVNFSDNNPELLKEMFNKQFLIKGLLFHSQGKVHEAVINSGDSSLLNIYNDLRRTRQQLAEYYEITDHPSVKPFLTDSLEQKIEGLQKQLALTTSANVFQSLHNEDYKWRDVQQALKDDEALVEFIRFRKYDSNASPDIINSTTDFGFGFTDSVYYAAIITTAETLDHPKLVLFREGRDMETRFLNYYKNALQYEVSDQNSYQYYWKPIAAYVKGKKHVFISNDGVYHKLNLNILKDPATKEYLIARHDIDLIANPLTILEKKKDNIRKEKTALLVGDPSFNKNPIQTLSKSRNFLVSDFSSLPETRREVQEISEKLKASGWETKVYLDEEATEENVVSTEAPEILHLATHGYFSDDIITKNATNENRPLFNSGLVFTGVNKQINGDTLFARQNNGILTAFEVMNMYLFGTDLVVLSACETGLGEVVNGEGVYGLQRSFLTAGANSVMISLWKVDDYATMDLMLLFYNNYLHGMDKRNALRMAQLEMSKKYKDPRHWGSFVLVGH